MFIQKEWVGMRVRGIPDFLSAQILFYFIFSSFYVSEFFKLNPENELIRSMCLKVEETRANYLID